MVQQQEVPITPGLWMLNENIPDIMGELQPHLWYQRWWEISPEVPSTPHYSRTHRRYSLNSYHNMARTFHNHSWNCHSRITATTAVQYYCCSSYCSSSLQFPDYGGVVHYSRTHRISSLNSYGTSAETFYSRFWGLTVVKCSAEVLNFPLQCILQYSNTEFLCYCGKFPLQ